MFSGLELRFEIVEIIGSGGFGRVFRAIDRLTGLDCALKELRHPMNGDGDAVGFPIVSKLIQPLEEILTKRFDDAQKSLPPTAADLIGRYKCGSGVSTIARAADGTLQIDRLGTYPWSLLPLDGQPDAYRLLMRTLPMTHAGCESKEYPGANLCQPSCFRQMARGDIELLYARRNHSKVTEIEVPGEGIVCVKE